MKASGFKLDSVLIFMAAGSLFAQILDATQQQPSYNRRQAPALVVQPATRRITAISYRHRTSPIYIDFRGTELMPVAAGTARVESQLGSTKIETALDHLSPANQFGPEYMTYVLWAITPEGRPTNLGELVLTGSHAKLLTATNLQRFGLIVTAEPYFAVTQPSNLVVAENLIRPDTLGPAEEINASYRVVERGQYIANPQYEPVRINPKGPLQLAEAENAVEIARLAGAGQFARDTFQKAVDDLKNAQDYLSHGSRRDAETAARQATQVAEDARLMTFRKIHEHQLAAQQALAEQREAQAQARAQQASEQACQGEERCEHEEADREAAERAKSQPDAARAQALHEGQAVEREADRTFAEAEAQRQEAQAEVDRARQEVQQSEQLGRQTEAERNQLRERLREQLNVILETRETARGLIVNLSDVLFDTGKYTLKAGAREKMAKLSGLLLAYPGLKIEVEGHTDCVGRGEYNQRLSQQRAETVREYLLAQGVPGTSVTAMGFGKAAPVASNDTPAGRQQNRRVEIVVSGEPIGVGATDVR